MIKRILTPVLLAVMLLALTLCAAASDVVFLADGGSGDGATASRPVGSLTDAFDALDLDKDCTVVVSGKFTVPKGNYTYGGEYDGSVTFTSVYDGIDYRESGAEYVFSPYCVACVCETKFENINLTSGSSGVVFVAQHHPFTIGEGVKITGKNLTGGTIAKSFTIIGGYYNASGFTAQPQSDKDTSITVLSGEKIYIVAVNRNIKGEYNGKAKIHVGGNASVSALNATAAGVNDIELGDIEITLTDNGSIGSFYGSTQTLRANSLTLNWQSGTIDKFFWDCPYMNPIGLVTFVNGTKLIASQKAQNLCRDRLAV